MVLRFLLLAYLLAAARGRLGGSGGEAARRGRRLGELLGRRLSVKQTSSRFLKERSQLPPYTLDSGLVLSEVVYFHRRSPWLLRHTKLHGASRRLAALEGVVSTPFAFFTPRERVRALATLSAVAGTSHTYTEGVGGAAHRLRRSWGDQVLADANSWIYPPPGCVNGTAHNSSAMPSWWNHSLTWFCGESNATVANLTADDNFAREAAYLNNVRQRVRKRITGSDGASILDQFIGLRLPPCVTNVTATDGNSETIGLDGRERCIDDVGVSLSVYQNSDTRVIVWHGGFHMDLDYFKWAAKKDILMHMENQLKVRWTTGARQVLTKEMMDRRGATKDELSSRCTFNSYDHEPWPGGTSFLDAMKQPRRQDQLTQEGLWFLIQELTRLILPETRNQFGEIPTFLTGGGMGGTFAALVSMWLAKYDGAYYKTYVFAPYGFQCIAHAHIPTDTDPWSSHHGHIHVYRHTLDALAEVGKVRGLVCEFGLRNISNNVLDYCSKVVGFTGPQLLCDDLDYPGTQDSAKPSPTCMAKLQKQFLDKVLPYPKLLKQWDKYKVDVAEAVKNFQACHYYTHSVWYTAYLLGDNATLRIDGTTEGGCVDIQPIAVEASILCPGWSPWSWRCGMAWEGIVPMPYWLMGFLMILIASVLTVGSMSVYILMHVIKHDDWIYGEDLVRHARGGIFDWRIIFGKCCRRDANRIVMAKRHDNLDRAKLARRRAELRAELKADRMRKRDDRNEIEMDPILRKQLQAERRQLWVIIHSAHGLRSGDWQGKSDPACVVRSHHCQARIATQVVIDCNEPVWNHVERLDGYTRGNDLEISIYDDDDGNNIEDGDIIGICTLEAPAFWPRGMQPRTLPLRNAGKDGAGILIEIVVQRKGAPTPKPTRILPPEIGHEKIQEQKRTTIAERKAKKKIVVEQEKKEKQDKKKEKKDKEKQDKKDKKDKKDKDDEKGKKEKKDMIDKKEAKQEKEKKNKKDKKDNKSKSGKETSESEKEHSDKEPLIDV